MSLLRKGAITSRRGIRPWLKGWSYRKSHVINPSPGAGTNYQIRVKAHYGSGSDGGEDVYLNQRCRTDFGDVRFTDNDGTTLLDYWMEGKVDGDYAIFWVEVADDLSSSSATIYVYYGKNDATTTSSGDDTFLFFDDFLGTTLDSSKWTSGARVGGVSVANGYATIAPGSTWDGVYLRTVPTVTFPNIAVETKFMLDGLASSGIPYAHNFGIYFINSTATYPRDTSYYYMISGTCPAPLFATYFGPRPHSNTKSGTVGSSVGTGVTADSYGGYESGGTLKSGATGYWFERTLSVFAVDWYRIRTFITNSTLKHDAYRSTVGQVYSKSATPNAIDIFGIGSQAKIELILWGYVVPSNRIDWVFVRKFVDPEPSHGAWGVEEH